MKPCCPSGNRLITLTNYLSIMNTPILTTTQENIAPWNKDTQEDKKFNCTITMVLSKDTDVWSNKYVIDEGSVIPDNDMEEDYTDQHYTPLELIEVLGKILASFRGKEGWKDYYEEIIEECQGWIDDEFTVSV